MSSYTTFDTYIDLKQDFKSIFSVNSKISELELDISDLEQDLLMYSISTPKDIFPNSENIISEIKNTILELLELYQDSVLTLYKLNKYKEYLEENNINE